MNKQEPVIKGVLPDGPSPAAVQKVQVATSIAQISRSATLNTRPGTVKGLFGWLKRLLGGAAAPAPTTSASDVAVTDVRVGERGDNQRDSRGRGRRTGDGRALREDRDHRTGQRPSNSRNGEVRGDTNRPLHTDVRHEHVPSEAARSDVRHNGRRDSRRANTPTETNAFQNAVVAPVQTGNAAIESDVPDGQRRERRSRDADRRRGEMTEGTAPISSEVPDAQRQATPDIPSDVSVIEDTPRAPRERRSRDRYGRDRRDRAPREAAIPANSNDSIPSETHSNSQESAPARSSYFALPVEPVEIAAQSDVIPSLGASAAASLLLQKVQPYTVSVEELSRIARSSGLEWVNSDADKVAAVQAMIAAEPAPPPLPRKSKVMVKMDEGPLVLVETRRDLRDIALPFERQ